MKIRHLLTLALVCAATAAAQERPNFIVVLVDDLRWDGTATTGHAFVETPAIDRIARQGVIFRNAFVTTPLCSPSRASFLTGRYARSHGVLTNNGILYSLQGTTTFPELLEDAGYQTAFIGKWHIGADGLPRPGFTRWVGFEGQGQYRNQVLNIDGRPTASQGYLTDVLYEHALEFIRNAASGPEPFLLFLSHKAVHEPFTRPPRHAAVYTNVPVPCSPGCDDTLEGKHALTRPVPGTEAPVPGKGGPNAQDIRAQMGLMNAVDQGLGEIYDELRALRILDDTVIVFTSDNGYFHREHALSDKRWPYEEALRIPFIVRYPRLADGGGTRDALVLNVDLAPTLLELAGIGTQESIEGSSLVPLLQGDARGWRTSFVAEYFDEVPFPRIPTWEAVRTTRFKLVRYPALGGEYDELYDLAGDPYELTNEIDNGAFAEDASRLHRLLDQLLAPLGDARR